MLDILSGRPAEDILGRVVRVTLGGVTYELPVLTIGANRRWKQGLDARLSALVDGIADEDNPDWSLVLGALDGQEDALIDLLIAYDQTGVLPEREAIIEATYDHELLAAVREVWRAANPFVVLALEAAAAAMTGAPENGSSPLTSSPPRPTDGRPASSKNGSATNSSSPTSARPVSASGKQAPNGSKKHASHTSSRATSRRTSDGAPAPDRAPAAPSATTH